MPSHLPAGQRWHWLSPEAARQLRGTLTVDRSGQRAGPRSRWRRIAHEIVESWRLMLV